jgi:hypothetical protein
MASDPPTPESFVPFSVMAERAPYPSLPISSCSTNSESGLTGRAHRSIVFRPPLNRELIPCQEPGVPNIKSTRFVVLCGGLLGGLLIGCSSSDPNSALARANETNMQRLANLYFTFQSQHDWRGPTGEAEFKSFLRKVSPQKLSRIGVDPAAVDKLFISERDGQPFKIRYGVLGSAMGSSAPVIFESTGDGNRRLVGFLDMQQREVDESEYNTLWSATASHAPHRENR